MVRTASFGGATGLGRHRSQGMSQGLRQTAGGARDRDELDGPTSRQGSDQGASKERVYGVVLIFSTLGRSEPAAFWSATSILCGYLQRLS
jgi:hypothetical protein